MDKINAISKVRFASAKPQNVGLHHGEALRATLLCMEPGQVADVKPDAERLYYVITGTARITAGPDTAELGTGEVIAFAPHRPHTVATADDRRLVCLVVDGAS